MYSTEFKHCRTFYLVVVHVEEMSGRENSLSCRNLRDIRQQNVWPLIEISGRAQNICRTLCVGNRIIISQGNFKFYMEYNVLFLSHRPWKLAIGVPARISLLMRKWMPKYGSFSINQTLCETWCPGKYRKNLLEHIYSHTGGCTIHVDVIHCRVLSNSKPDSQCDLLTMKRQWTYGATLLPLFDHFHTSLACFTAL